MAKGSSFRITCRWDKDTPLRFDKELSIKLGEAIDGKSGECYDNAPRALKYGLDHGLLPAGSRVVEGTGTYMNDNLRFTYHVWIQTPDGRIVDTTPVEYCRWDSDLQKHIPGTEWGWTRWRTTAKQRQKSGVNTLVAHPGSIGSSPVPLCSSPRG